MANCLCDVLGAGCTILLITALPVVQISLGAVYMYECPVAPAIPVYVMVFGIWVLLMTAMFALPRLLCPGATRPTIWTVLIIILLLVFFIGLLFGSYQIYSIYTPNYHKNRTDSNSSVSRIYTSPGPDIKLSLTSKNKRILNLNQTMNLNNLTLNLNQTQINNKLTLGDMIQTLALININIKTNGELSNLQHPVVSYCNRTLYMFAFWTTTLVYVIAGITMLVMMCLYCFMKCTDLFVQHLTT